MATVRTAIIMQDRMSPVLNKMLVTMQKTIAVMETLDQTSNTVMSNVSGIKQAQAAMNATCNGIVKMQSELEALNKQKVTVVVHIQRQDTQQMSSFSSGTPFVKSSLAPSKPAIPDAQQTATPPSSVFIPPATSQGAFTSLNKESQEANAAAQKVQSAINGIRAPNIDASSALASMQSIYKEARNSSNEFMKTGNSGSQAGQAISRAMSQAKVNTSNINTENLRLSKAFDTIDYKAVQLGSNSFGNQLNNQLQKVSQASNVAEGSVGNVGKSMNGLKMLSSGIDLAKKFGSAINGAAGYLDALNNITTRLNFVNDGTQTTAELQGKIMQAANNSRSSYQDMAASVAKLNSSAGNTFKTNDEAIVFTEQLNKMSVVSGASKQESSTARDQVTQAMASGGIQGDEYQSIIANVPMLGSAIEASTGKSRAEIMQMSADGQLSADIIKRAIIDSTGVVNEQFSQIPMTFGQSMTFIQNDADAKLQAVGEAFKNMMNSDDIQVISDIIGATITTAAYVAMGAINALTGVIGFLGDNMSWLGPLIGGLAIAFGLYTTALIVHNIAQGISTALKTLAAISAASHSIAITAEMAATAGMTQAQLAFNSALYACPLTWIIIAIIAIIAIIFMVVAAINHFAGSSISATGIVVGVFFWLGAVIYNIIMGAVNIIFWFINWFARIWNNPEYAAKLALGNMYKGILDLCIDGLTSIDGFATGLANAFIWAAKKACDGINWIIEKLNKIPGIDIDPVGGSLEYTESAMANKISALQSQKADIDKWIGDKPKGWDDNLLDYKAFKDPGQSYQNGYTWGKELEQKIANFGDFGNKDTPLEDDTLDKINKGLENVESAAKSPTINGGKLDEVNDVEITDEDIKMLKDIASTKFVNQFTTLQPNMSVSFGDVHETANIDKIMDAIETMTEQALAETILEEN